jgi:Mn-dependent DtxR family transcriptional regulator
MPAKAIKPRARQIIAAMREVLARDIEMTGFNIAGILNEDVGTIGSYLNGMAKDGLVFRMGLRLQYNGRTRTKHMMWKLNHKLIRKLENEKTETLEAEGTPGTMHEVPRDQAAERVQLDRIQNALVLVQRVPPNPVP